MSSKKTSLSIEDEKFTSLIAQGKPKSEAYKEAYNPDVKYATIAACKTLQAHQELRDAIEAKKEHFKLMANIEAEHIVGAQVELAFAPIEEALDDQGRLDFKKAKKTGATRLIKKITMRRGKGGTTTSVEFYSRADALNQLATMLGLNKAPQVNDHRTRLIDAIEKVMRVEDCDFQSAFEYIKRKQAEGDVKIFTDELLAQVEREHGYKPVIDIGAQ
jgi:hypothetical protein